MLDYNIYNEIAQRSGGDIYIGVVGPMRTGKSTFIQKFMTELIIPNVADEYVKRMMQDELPQSASGRTVMTTEPKFVPAKAVCVQVASAQANVRLVDCVGYVVEGVQGLEEEGVPRYVHTPWQAEELTFSQAASLGTQKVIQEHSTVAICVTTDGSFTELGREAYLSAEERTVAELKAGGKPFILLLNTTDPKSEGARVLQNNLKEKYQCSVVCMNCQNMTAGDALDVLKALLFEFPLLSVHFKVPEWLNVLGAESSAIAELLGRVRKEMQQVQKLCDLEDVNRILSGANFWSEECSLQVSPATGNAEIEVFAKEGVFYQMLAEIAGCPLESELALMQYVQSASQAKRDFDRIKDAFAYAKTTGYGVVTPNDEELHFDQPKSIRMGGNVGMKLKAHAESYHIIKVDVQGEVNPVLGTAMQGEELVQELLTRYEERPQDLLEMNVFGKSLKCMAKECLESKVVAMKEDTRSKMRRTLTRIVNEGKGGVICILL